MITKIECNNHLLHNYINRLRDVEICQKKSEKSKGETIPGFLRKIVQTRLIRLRYAVTESIKYNLK
jgi:hypothetical protein